MTIQNLQASSYWTGTRWELPENGTYYWTFVSKYGETNAAYEYTAQYGWAVRDGDVAAAPIPEPATLLLMGTGITALIGARKKKKP
ncbi:MAG: PEP-CTERM sorting domain-containing protein [Pseudomonadota bacterium]